MLIHADNLLALKALEQNFAGKIKCIYIDPPFNTGSAFEHYDDGLEHSIWLSLIKDRLEILRKLLSNNGSIYVHIDNNEQGYLKVIMYEIFGRNNFVQIISIKINPYFLCLLFIKLYISFIQIYKQLYVSILQTFSLFYF